MNKMYIVGAVALLLAGMGLMSIINSFSASQKVMVQVASEEGKKVGAYVVSTPTTLTDLHLTNDLVVDGLTTFTGASGVTGALTVTGAATFNGGASVVQTSSSTLTIGSSASVACLQMYNAAGSGLVYITTASSTLSATTTKPTACR